MVRKTISFCALLASAFVPQGFQQRTRVNVAEWVRQTLGYPRFAFRTLCLFAVGFFCLSILSVGHAQRVYEPNATVETLAGSGFFGFVDGQGEQTMFYNPEHLCRFDTNSTLVWDRGNARIRRVFDDGTVINFCGSGTRGHLDADATQARLTYVFGFTKLPSGSIFAQCEFPVSGQSWGCSRYIYSNGSITTVATYQSGFQDGAFSSARFGYQPQPISLPNGSVLFADQGNNRIRLLTTNEIVSTFAGSGNPGTQDGSGIFSSFTSPHAPAIDGAGNIYVADGIGFNSPRVRRVSADATVTTIAGGGSGATAKDSTGTNAAFTFIYGMTCDTNGNVFVADETSIRMVRPNGVVTTVAGSSRGYTNGPGNRAAFLQPGGIAIDSIGRLIVSDYDGHRIRRITIGQPVEPLSTNSLAIKLLPSVTISGEPGHTYRIEYSTLANTNWDQAAVITLMTPSQLWVDTNTAPSQRFYRSVLLN